jgi:hypothetical protein
MASADNQDERIAKRADNGSARADRLTTDRTITENREKTDAVRAAERHAMLRDTNTLLPIPPDMPGYHLVWLTTTNSKDSLETRFRLGYELVKRAELPDFALNSQKGGDLTEDRISVNEMVLAKIPYDLWVQDMTYLHHTLPNESAKNLRDSVRIGQDGKGRNVAYTGGDFNGGVSDGFNSLGQAKAPNFVGIR